MAAVKHVVVLKKVFFNQKGVSTSGGDLRTDLEAIAWSKDLGLVELGL